MLRRPVTIIAATAVTVLVAGLGPAGASAAPRDVAATHAYELANYKLAKASETLAGAAQADVVSLNRKLAGECKSVGKGAPENSVSQKMSYEVAGALWSVAYGKVSGPIQAFARAVAPLRWSDGGLTRRAKAYAKSLEELAALPLPNLCGDVREWKTSGFRTIPAQTVSFDQHAEAIEPHIVPQKLLAPYVSPGDRGIVQRTMGLETKLEHTETITGFDDWDMVLETLGINQ